MSKQFIGVILAIILLAVGVMVASGSDQPKSSSNSKTLTQHVKGTNSAGVTLVEYGDYQCPYCQAYHSIVKEVVAQYEDRIQFQFRNFPITSAHPNAFAAARAAEAAALQDKFWEMHDLIYQNADPNGRSGWVAASDPTSFFDQFAKQISLDMTKYKKDFASETVNDLIIADQAEAARLDVTGTPTFFLNGKKVTIAGSVEAFKKALDAEIAKKQPKASTTPNAAAGTSEAGTPEAATSDTAL